MSVRKYVKSFVSFSLGTWIRAILSFFTTPIITYLINPDEFGKSAMYVTAFGIANMIVLLGTDQTFVRFFYDYEEQKRNRLLWSCLFPSLVIATLLSVALLVLSDRVGLVLYGKAYPHINLFFVLNLYLALFQRYNHLIVRMLKKGTLYSMIDVVAAASATVSTILFALTISRTFYSIILGNLVGTFFALLVGISQGREYWKPIKPTRAELREVLRFGLPLVPASLMFWLFTSMDRIILRQYSTFEQIGLYAAAFKVVSVINLIQTGFTTFWTPTAYERSSKNLSDSQFFVRANDMVSFVMFLAAFLLLAFKDVVFLLLARPYRASSMIFPFLLFSPIMYSVSETTVVWINFKKKTYWHIVITAVSALVNYIGNALLVPVYAARGAAISTGVSYIVFFWMRTIISIGLCPEAGYKLKKMICATALMTFAALVGTFQNSPLVNVLIGLSGIPITIVIYKESFLALKDEISVMLRSKSHT